jgi:UDP-N-acetylmuramyl pentapeptide phosphotransferase/UDP-N-acetylglucosamine-1-phosphate transferase
MTDLHISTPHLAAFVLALFSGLAIVLTQRWHGRYTFDLQTGVQRAHTRPTPRVGGVAIFIALVCAAALADQGAQGILYPTLLASAPALLFGLAEDITKRVGAMTRLLATMASGAIAWYLTGVSLTSVGVPVLDQLLGFTVISVLFTAFAVGGISNAVNLIDGYNGMASGFVILALLTLASVAGNAGDVPLQQSALLCAAAFAGFFLINWPWGRLFMGDSGAYMGGFVVAWFCVLLCQRNEGVSPFAALLICVHPVTETVFSVWRRVKQGLTPGQPDSLHLHNMIFAKVVRLVGERKQLANPVSGVMLAMLSVPSALLAPHVYQSALACVGLTLAFVVFYALTYFAIESGSISIRKNASLDMPRD